MKKFLIHCSTYWCGMDNTYRALAEKEDDLWEIADHLAYENFLCYCGTEDILEELGYDVDELSEEEIDSIMESVDESAYYFASIEECSDEEWEDYNDCELINV